MQYRALLLALLTAQAVLPAAYAQQPGTSDSVDELRNTLVGVLDALVQKGLLTRDQAQQIVSNAQAKAAADAKSKAAAESDEKDAVRVNFIPENIKADIEEKVAADLRSKVAGDVVATAKQERWGVPGALPDWVRNLTLYGDVRMRLENAVYAKDNAQNVYVNFDTVNTAGGIGKAGATALLNVSEDRFRSLIRLRTGIQADLGNHFKADLRLASGTGRTVGSTNQTLGSYNARSAINVDKAAVIWDPVNRKNTQEFELRAGRFENPWRTTSELLWDNDLTFEGMSATYALDLWGRDPARMERSVYLTVGAMPLQEVELSTRDKWLYAAQLGTELPVTEAAMIRFSAALYDFKNITGIGNAADSTLTDYTAPKYLSKGNSLFDIRNSTTDSTVNLYALASDFRIENANLSIEVQMPARKRLTLAAEYVNNIGFDADEILKRTASVIEPRTSGYDVSLAVGDVSLNHFGAWRTSVAYRQLQRDAVLDAFTDSDFHLGGTDAKGYIYTLDLGLSRSTFLRARLMSASEIDGPPLGINVFQLDLTGSL